MITNKEVCRFRDTIFANNNKDIRRSLPMAGRTTELAAYRSVFLAEGPHIVTISGLLGSGKTFFLDAARGHLINDLGFPEHLNAHQVDGTDGGDSADDLAHRFANADPAFRRMVELEEMDRKGELDVMMRAVGSAVEWLTTTRDGLLVVTGDRLLEHPAVADVLAGPGIPITAINLEPLDRPLLTEALRLRLGSLSENAEPPSRSDVDKAAEQILGEILFERTLLPPTSPSTATFRDAFGLLKNVAGELNRQSPGVSFSLSDVVKLAPRGHAARTKEQERVDAEVQARVRQMLQAGTIMVPLETEEIRLLAGTKDTGKELFWSLVQPLVSGQVLEPLGVPYCDHGKSDADLKYVGPFLPRQRVLLRVLKSLKEGG